MVPTLPVTRQLNMPWEDSGPYTVISGSSEKEYLSPTLGVGEVRGVPAPGHDAKSRKTGKIWRSCSFLIQRQLFSEAGLVTQSEHQTL